MKKLFMCLLQFYDLITDKISMHVKTFNSLCLDTIMSRQPSNYTLGSLIGQLAIQVLQST